MILKTQDIKQILKERPNSALVSSAQEYTKKLLMHMKGIGLKEAIERMDGFERKEVLAIRKKYTRSNKDLFERLHRPVDKVFSARGGSVYYDLPDSQKRQFQEDLTDIEFGYSVRRWIEVFWRPAFHYDPMGMIFMEVDKIGAAYPTYKSVLDVYDYNLNGRNLEYVVFDIDPRIIDQKKKQPDRKYYRVVDDMFDKLVEWDGDNFKVIDTYNNYFGRVPATIISDIYDPQREMFISPDDSVIELADEFLRDGSVKSIFKKYFGFPQAWQYITGCNNCKGTGLYEGSSCSNCNGTGKETKTNVESVLNLPTPTTKDQPSLIPPKGYITPDVEGWTKMSEEISLLENIMFQTFWGTHQLENEGNNTATGKFIDVQPVNDRLNKFSDAAEYAEKFTVDMMGQFIYPQSYKGSSINYGRRFLIETPDEIWEKYEKARTANAPVSALNDILREYYQARYASDSIELAKYLKLMRVEPLVHISIMNAKTLLGDQSPMYLKKLLFGDWLSSINESILLSADVPTLQALLSDYAIKNGVGLVVVPEPKQVFSN